MMVFQQSQLFSQTTTSPSALRTTLRSPTAAESGAGGMVIQQQRLPLGTKATPKMTSIDEA